MLKHLAKKKYCKFSMDAQLSVFVVGRFINELYHGVSDHES